MQYRTYKETMLPQMVRLWKEEAVRIRYKAYDSPEEWKAELLDKPDFDPEGCILAFTDSGSLAGFAAAISQKEFLPGQNRDNTPGYIFLLVVKEEYEGRGVGSSLLEKAEAFLKGQGKHEIRISHKCPIKMSWYIDREGHEHNKAPGIRTDSPGYIFFREGGMSWFKKRFLITWNWKNFTFRQMYRNTSWSWSRRESELPGLTVPGISDMRKCLSV